MKNSTITKYSSFLYIQRKGGLSFPHQPLHNSLIFCFLKKELCCLQWWPLIGVGTLGNRMHCSPSSSLAEPGPRRAPTWQGAAAVA